jgi:hypothetical protein
VKGVRASGTDAQRVFQIGVFDHVLEDSLGCWGAADIAHAHKQNLRFHT